MNKNLWFFRSKMKKLMNETGIWVQNRAFVVLIIRFLKYFTTEAEADDFTEKAAEHNIHPISRDTIEEAKRQHDRELDEMRRAIR